MLTKSVTNPGPQDPALSCPRKEALHLTLAGTGVLEQWCNGNILSRHL
jgi:hypothetical protein